MVKLGVNIDHIATIRQARRDEVPDPVIAASICEMAGAEGITVHLREDRRHIQDRDVRLLRQTIKSKLNLEMAIHPEIVDIALEIKPDDVCIVPEKRMELTTEGGLDVGGQREEMAAVVHKLQSAGIRVSLFIDPDDAQIKAAIDVKADCVELHTGKYAESWKLHTHDGRQIEKELDRIKRASALVLVSGLTLNAGHGLDYKNVGPIARIPGMNELNIGFSIIARSVIVGLDQAVREMIEQLK
jgi:pyridoxine 5-phosphate synthase